jgi:hypothetical protein
VRTPALVLPTTPTVGTQATPDLRLDDPYFEGELLHNLPQNAPQTPSLVTPEFDRQPMELQCIWGTTPTFFQKIPIDLPRLQEAMDKEMTAIIGAKTYKLVLIDSVQPGAKMPVWSFCIKFDRTFKACLCFPGHHQQYGINYFDTESPVAKSTTFQMLKAMFFTFYFWTNKTTHTTQEIGIETPFFFILF